MKPVEIHRKAREAIRTFSKDARNELGSALTKLQLGMTLGFPLSRPMPSVHPGAHELRLRDSGRNTARFLFFKIAKRHPGVPRVRQEKPENAER